MVLGRCKLQGSSTAQAVTPPPKQNKQGLKIPRLGLVCTVVGDVSQEHEEKPRAASLDTVLHLDVADSAPPPPPLGSQSLVAMTHGMLRVAEELLV